MSIGAYCVHKVVTAQPEDTAAAAAQCMAQHDVGALVLTEDEKSVGIVTDRDLVLRVLAKGDDPQNVALRMVMTTSLVCVTEDTSLEEAVARMRTSHIRRLDPKGHRNGRTAGPWFSARRPQDLWRP